MTTLQSCGPSMFQRARLWPFVRPLVGFAAAMASGTRTFRPGRAGPINSPRCLPPAPGPRTSAPSAVTTTGPATGSSVGLLRRDPGSAGWDDLRVGQLIGDQWHPQRVPPHGCTQASGQQYNQRDRIARQAEACNRDQQEGCSCAMQALMTHAPTRQPDIWQAALLAGHRHSVRYAGRKGSARQCGQAFMSGRASRCRTYDRSS